MTSLLSTAIHSCTSISVYPSLTYTEVHTCTVFFPDIDINFNMMVFKGLIHAKSYQYGLSGTKNHVVLSAILCFSQSSRSPPPSSTAVPPPPFKFSPRRLILSIPPSSLQLWIFFLWTSLIINSSFWKFHHILERNSLVKLSLILLLIFIEIIKRRKLLENKINKR